MKKIAAVIVALAILIAGLPALLGTLAQGRIHFLAETASSGHYLQVSITEYQRGWRNSRASVSVALSEAYRALFEAPFPQGPDAPDLPQELQDPLGWELRLAVDMVHGPFLTRGGVGVGLADAVVRLDSVTGGLEELSAVLDSQDPIEGMARIRIASVSPFRWTIPSITIPDPDSDSTFESSALVGEGAYHINREHLVVRNQMDNLRMSGQPGALEMQDLTISADLTAIARGIWTGASEVGIGSLSLAGRDNSPIATLGNLSIRSLNAATEGGDRINVDIEVQADTVEGTVDGDAQHINDLGLSVALRNVDMAATLEYQEVFFDLAETGVLSADPSGLLAELQPIIYDFLEAELELEYGPLSFNWNDSTLQARVLLRIDNEMLPAEPMFSLTDTSLWPRLVNVDAELDVDRNIAEWIATQAMARQPGAPVETPTDVPADILQSQARGTLVALVAQGMLEETESGYRFRGSYENGVVEVNGQVIPIGPGAQDAF